MARRQAAFPIGGQVEFGEPLVEVLCRYLPADRADDFAQNRRYIFCRQGGAGEFEVKELNYDSP